MAENDTTQKGISSGKVPPRPIASVYEFYVSGEISQPEDYIEWFDTIRHAGENDVIKIYINSYGGELFTAIQFMRVFAETPATIVVSVEGMCMSAATVIFLCADAYEVTPHSIFMFHNYSGATGGKGGEMIDQLMHERKWSERLMGEIYKDFLTPEEIRSMLDNRDLWMDGEEVVKRLNVRMEKRTEEAEKAEKPARKKPVVAKKAPAKSKPPLKKVD
jgi:ATP-dependent protease ClpP protease subunit